MPRSLARWLRVLVPAVLIVAWLAAAAVGGPYFGRVEEVSSNDQTTFLPESADATVVQSRLDEFQDGDSLPAILVFTSDEKLSESALGELQESLDRAAGVDGVLLPPPLCDSAFVVDRLEAAGLPAVAVASGQPMPSVSAIRIDDQAAAEAMTRHLIGLGHRRIAFVRGHPNQTASALRFKGYAKALKAHGLEIDDRLVAQGYFTYHSGLDAADQLLTLRHRPTAIFASNDDMAAAAIAVAHRQGLDVPRDLTIVGFDDTALASTVWPPLTTIRQPVAEMSREAVSVLVEAIRGKQEGQPSAPARELMDFALIRRQSDGHPPAGVDEPPPAKPRPSTR